MTSSVETSDTWPFVSPWASKYFTRRRREGWRGAHVHAILIVLETRGLDVNDDEWVRVVTCGNLRQLDKWLRRAVTVEQASDIFD